MRLLARDLPAFDSVWIDALVQARRLTHFQARILQSAHPEHLRVGPCVLIDQLGCGVRGRTYVASQPNRRTCVLKLIDKSAGVARGAADTLVEVVERNRAIRSSHYVGPHARIVLDTHIVTLSRHVDGLTLAELLVRRGRFPSQIVMEIGRQLIAGLVQAERAEVVHGDINLKNVRMSSGGIVTMVDGGLAPALHPQLTIHAQFPPDRYDGLAPELVGTGAEFTGASDMYALGCLLWQLLAGRPPYPNGDSLAKIAQHQTRRIPDVRKWAPDTPPELAKRLHDLTAPDPRGRPESFRRLADDWRQGGRRNRRQLGRFRATFDSEVRPERTRPVDRPKRRWPAAAAAAVLLLGFATALIDQRARNQILQWQWPLSGGFLSDQEADPNVPTEDQVAAMPDPNPEGVVLLDAGTTYIAESVSLGRPVIIRGTGTSPSVLRVTEPVRWEAEQVVLENVVVDCNDGGRVAIETELLSLRSCLVVSDVTWNAIADDSAVVLEDCVFLDGASLRMSMSPQRIDCVNCLKVGRGPLLEAVGPRARRMEVDLQQVTLRDSGPLLVVRSESGVSLIAVTAGASVFHLSDDEPLIRFVDTDPVRLQVTGEAALISATARLAVAERDGELRDWPRKQLRVEGLLAAPFTFRANDTDDITASVVEYWEAPQAVDETSVPDIVRPGIDPERLSVLTGSASDSD